MAVERMRTCEGVRELVKELGVTRRCLYKWRAKLDLAETAEELAPENDEYCAPRFPDVAD